MKISIVMEALTGRFETDTDRAGKRFNRNMKQMRRDAARFGRQVALAMTAAVAAITVAVNRSVAFADSIGKTADKLGIGTEALQEYRFAAERAGLADGQLDKSLEILNRRIGETTQGTGEGKVAFEKLGISIRDVAGNVRPTESILRDVADAMGELPSQAERAAIANQLFGRAGAGMLNVLRDGSAGLDAYAKAARNLGVVLEDNLVRDAEKAADKMGDLRQVLQVNIATAVLRNTDSILALTESLISFVGAVGRAVEGWNFWRAQQSGAFGNLTQINAQIQTLVADNLRIRAELEKPTVLGGFIPFRGGEAELKRQLDANLKAIADLQLQAKELLAEPVQLNVEIVPTSSAEFLALEASLQKQIALFGQVGQAAKIAYDIQSGSLDALSGAEQQQVLALARQYDVLVLNAEAAKEAAAEAKKLQDARERALENIQQTVDALEQEVATLGMSERAAQVYRLGLEGAAQAQIDHADSLLRTIETHNEMQKLMADAALVYQSTRTDLEDFNAELERLNILRNTFVDGNPLIDEETYTRAVEAAREALEGVSQMDEFAKRAAQNIQDIFADLIFDPFADGLDGMVIGFANAMRRMLAEAAAAALLKELFGGLAGSSNSFLAALGKQFGGARDSGGRGYPGQAYLINPVAAPEMFIPDTAGTFVPNADRLGGQNITYQTIVQAPEGRITRESEGRLRARDQQRGALMAGRNG